MSDLISRQAAIDALGDKPLAWMEGEYELGLQNQWLSDVYALKGMPSVEPKHGKWKRSKFYKSIIICDECGEPFELSNSMEHWNYCPNCGARIDGDDTATAADMKKD